MSARPAPLTPPVSGAPRLWPKPIPVLGLTGEKWAGKTSFALTIDPERTKIYDTELSSESYAGDVPCLVRVDVMGEMFKRFPRGHKAIDRFLWWLEDVRNTPVGKFSVIVNDTVNEIENGLADWVEAHPEHFGHTREQYKKMSGIKWGDVKDYWLSIIASELAPRCQTWVFTTHMGDVWSEGKPVPGKRKAKGKETLDQLASLYLEMERPKNAKGELLNGGVPSARVRKERTSSLVKDASTGTYHVVSHFPPRLPVATPEEVRKRMLTALGALSPEEMAPDRPQTAEEAAEVRLRTAEAERDAEQFRLEREQRQREAEERRAARSAASQVTVPPPVIANGPAAESDATPAATPTPPRGTVTDGQLATLKQYRDELFEGQPADAVKAAWQSILAKRGVSSALQLSTEAAQQLIAGISHRLNVRQIDRGINGVNATGTTPNGSPGVVGHTSQEGGVAVQPAPKSVAQEQAGATSH